MDLVEDADEPMNELGPYDIADAPAGVERLDLGSLHVPAVKDVEIRVQAGEDGVVQQVVLVNGDSALQLGVFAAPRTAGIWDEVRAEIKSTLFADGVAVEEGDGDYGAELRARVRTPEGLTDLRFIGVDGPRWMIRAVFQGPAALDPGVATPLVDCLHGLVVDRGKEAMPVREALPLRLPKDVAEQAAEQAAEKAQLEAGETAAAGPKATNGTKPSSSRRRPSPRPRRSG